MEPTDDLMFRGGLEPRSRTSMMSVLLLDRTPDCDAVRNAFDRASRIVLRLRQRVVVPTLAVGPPHWIVNPVLDLSYHVRRTRYPPPGSVRQARDMAQPIHAAPLDPTRPLWEATLIEGLSGEDGVEAAMLMKLNHAVTDGLGGVALFCELSDMMRDADRGPTPPMPVPVEVTPFELTQQAARRAPVIPSRRPAAGSRRCSVPASGAALK